MRKGVVSAQKTCPVMGGQVSADNFVDYGGRRVYFCCPACESPFSQDPEKYLKKVDAEAAGPKGQ